MTGSTRKQLPDDPALNMRQVWLGPANSWRWPFDATYDEWKVAAILGFASGLAFWLVLPVIVPIAGLGWWLARFVRRNLFPEQPWGRRAVIIGYILMLGLFIPSLRFWLTPMPLLLAAIVGPLVGTVITWRIGKRITPDRPLRYWVALPFRVARGPRRHQARTYDVTPLALTADAPYKAARIRREDI